MRHGEQVRRSDLVAARKHDRRQPGVHAVDRKVAGEVQNHECERGPKVLALPNLRRARLRGDGRHEDVRSRQVVRHLDAPKRRFSHVDLPVHGGPVGRFGRKAVEDERIEHRQCTDRIADVP